MLPSAGAALTEADLPDNARNRLKQVTRLAEWQSDMIEHWLWSPDARPSKTNTQMLLAVEDDGPGFRRLPKASASARQEWPARPSSTAEGLSAVEAASEQRGRACGCQWSCPGWKGGLPMRLVLCDENRIMSEALASVLQA
ncbi:MAG TPA: hypothetical protein VF070_47430, partial [Streptosporangiaceae bacterium]